MFASRIDTPLLADPTGVTYAPVLHVRWQNDGSGLTHFPQDRPATPASFAPSGSTDFTLNDDGLDPSGREFAVSVRNPNSGSGAGPLFRSGRLTALPGSLPDNVNGFLSLAFPDRADQTVEQVNSALQKRFENGPLPTRDPTVSVTGVVMAANPNRPSTWLMTAFGAYTGTIPIPSLATLFYRYSAEFSLAPMQDPFDTSLIVTAQLDAPGVVFSDAPGGGPTVTLADSFVSWFLNMASPLMADLMRDIVASAISAAISNDIRRRVSVALGVPRNPDGTPGPLPPNLTVSVQQVNISQNSLMALATVGGFGPLLTQSPSTGCSLAMALPFGVSVAMLLLWAFS